jgi:hypothetical protein
MTTEDAFRLTLLEAAAEGQAEPVRAWRLSASAHAGAREPRAWWTWAWLQSVARARDGAVVTVTGEGVGKSHLVEAARDEAADAG